MNRGEMTTSAFYDTHWRWDFPELNFSQIAEASENGTMKFDKSGRLSVWEGTMLGIVLGVLCLLTTAGNAMVLYAVRTEKRLQTVSNMFIVSLAVSDLVVGAIVMPISVTYILTVDWLFGVGLCQFWIAVDYTASTASILNLFILSLDRYWSVTSPLRYMRKRTKSRAKRMISVVWLVSALWIIPVVGWHFFANDGIRTVPSDTCDTEYATNLTFKVVTAIFNFYLPLGIMYTLYGKVFVEIRKRAQFEIGQKNTCDRYSGPTIASCIDDSDHKNSTFGDDDTPPDGCHDAINDESQAATRATEMCESNITNYVYDESVSDAKTERVDRYIYARPIIHEQGIPQENDSESTEKSIINDTCIQFRNASKYYKSDKFNTNFNFSLREKQKGEVKQPLAKTSISETVRPKEIDGILTNRHKVFDRTAKKFRQNNKIIQKSFTFSRSESSVLFKGDNTPQHARFQKSNSSSQLRGCNSDIESALKADNARQVLRIKRTTTFKDRMTILNHSTQLSKEIKAARQLGVIMGAFTLCFLPYFILFLYVGFCEDCISPHVMAAMTWVGYLNSTLNPCLYPLCNANFRRTFRKKFRFRSWNAQRSCNAERNSYFSARFD